MILACLDIGEEKVLVLPTSESRVSLLAFLPIPRPFLGGRLLASGLESHTSQIVHSISNI